MTVVPRYTHSYDCSTETTVIQGVNTSEFLENIKLIRTGIGSRGK